MDSIISSHNYDLVFNWKVDWGMSKEYECKLRYRPISECAGKNCMDERYDLYFTIPIYYCNANNSSTWGLQSAIVCMCKIIFCYVLSPNLFSLDAPVAGYSHRRLWILFLIPCRRKWSWLAVFFTHPPVHYVHLSLAPLQKCGLYEWMTATNIFTARHTFELRVVVSLY